MRANHSLTPNVTSTGISQKQNKFLSNSLCKQCTTFSNQSFGCQKQTQVESAFVSSPSNSRSRSACQSTSSKQDDLKPKFVDFAVAPEKARTPEEIAESAEDVILRAKTHLANMRSRDTSVTLPSSIPTTFSTSTKSKTSDSVRSRQERTRGSSTSTAKPKPETQDNSWEPPSLHVSAEDDTQLKVSKSASAGVSRANKAKPPRRSSASRGQSSASSRTPRRRTPPRLLNPKDPSKPKPSLPSSPQSEIRSNIASISPSLTPSLSLKESKEIPSAPFAEPKAESVTLLSNLDPETVTALPPQELILKISSIADVTTAHIAPPEVQEGEEVDVKTATSAQPANSMSRVVVDRMEDGRVELADGTWFEKQSGEEFGANGYWSRWTVISGSSKDGKVQWEERWWQASDWSGFKEMGAEKAGCAADGRVWREVWNEKVARADEKGCRFVERWAQKQGTGLTGTKWEEQWNEKYYEDGETHKHADKWAREGGKIWHEKWGESYNGQGQCDKYTDRWGEMLDMNGDWTHAWGDKWSENFENGKGHKAGETWSKDRSGFEYSMNKWGEEHFGEGWVRKFGSSTSGDQWDTTEQSGTHYNPIPHFSFGHALSHSPQLLKVECLPLDYYSIEDGGLDSL